MSKTMRRKSDFGRVLVSGSSLMMIGAALTARTGSAADITISTSIGTGTVWSGTANPASNLTVTNTGTINTANAYGVTITGTAGSQLGTLVNNGAIIDTAANGRAVFIQAGSVAAVVNNGSISAGTYSLWNAGSIGTFTNNGLISGRLVNQSTIATFNNTGTLTYSSFTFDNESQLRTLTNSGLIYGDRALYSQGTIGTIINSGTIQGTIHALTITGVGAVGTLANTGVVIGNILNSGTVNLTIAGGSGSTIGTLTGTTSNTGTINNTSSNLYLSGNLLLNDHINVGTRTVTADGAALTLTNAISITGKYNQNGGTLALGELGVARLNVSGAATLSNVSVTSSLSNTANYLVGNSNTLIGGGSGSSFSNITVSTNALTGLSTTTTLASSGVLLVASNDYIGGTLASLANTGSIGAAYGVYVASSGSLGSLSNSGTISTTNTGIYNRGSIGALSNSGTISGSAAAIYTDAGSTALGPIANTGVIAGKIENASSNNLTISGGSGSTFGTLTGTTLSNIGTIVNSLSNLVLSSGNLLLNDHIYASGHTVENTGASLRLDNAISITGDYRQSSGTLSVSPGQGSLAVSGAASVTGGKIVANLANSANYLVGTNYTVVAGGAGSSYSGATLESSTLTGLSAGVSVSGNNLLLGVNNNYIGGTLASLANTANIATAYGVYVAASGNLGSLSNSGALSGSNGIYNLGTIGGIANSGAVGSVSNDGVINGASAISSNGTIGSLTNSGTISGTTYAINNSGSLGLIANSGLIAGNITNSSVGDLRIDGGAGSVFGTLTGAGGAIAAANIGTITNTASNVVFASGKLLLNDAINAGSGTVINSGATLRINNAISITGNYRQDSAATLHIGVADGATSAGSASDAGYGRLVVSGTATIAAGSAISLARQNNYVFAQGQRFLIVTAAAGSAYNAAALNYSATSYSGPFSAETIASGGQSNLLVCLDNACSTSSTTPGTPTSSASTTTPAAPATPNAIARSMASASNAIASLTGIFNTPATNTALEPIYNAVVATAAQGTAAANRAGAQLGVVPSASTGAQAAAAPTTAVLNVVAARSDSMRLAQAKGASGVATGESPLDWAAWGQAFGGRADLAERNDVAGNNARFGGLLLGSDAQVSDRWRVGGLVSYGKTSVDNTGYNAGSGTDIDSLGLIGYGSYTADQWYANLSGGVVGHKYTTQRKIDITNFSGTAAGQHDGTQYVLSAQVGRPLDIGAYLSNATLTPLLGLSYSHLSQEAYTETGSAAALSVAKSNSRSLVSELGAKLERGYSTRYGELVPALQLGWRHQYANSPQATNASFAADSSGATGFTTMSASPIADTAALSLGVTLLHGKNLSVAAKYDIEAGSGYTAQNANVRLRWAF